jgi:hypothetical protein
MSADIRGLERQMAKAKAVVNTTATGAERRFKAMNDNLTNKFGLGIGASLRKELDGVASRAGPASAALAGFGVAGVAAAAAIGAVAAAFSGARQAAAFADNIADTAARLHVTTDALQEYRYAIRAAGGDEQGADEALEKFSITLGKAQQGLAKSQKAFLALGFTKAQIKGFTDADTALKAVVERIAGLSDVQQDAVIQQLGLEGIKPLIDDGVASMQRLREEAHKVGIVMDADLVRRGGELNDEFETLARVIDVQIKSALVDLGPVLVDLLRKMADLAKLGASVADAFKDIEHKRTQRLKTLAEGFEARSKTPLTQIFGGPAKDLERAARVRAELAKREASNKPPPVEPTRELIDTSSSGGGKKKDTTAADAKSRADRQERAEELIYRAMLAELDIHNGARRSIEERRDLTLDRLAVEETHRKVELDQLEEDYRISEGKQGITKVERQRLETLEASVRSGERLNVREEAALDLAEQQARHEADLSALSSEALSIAGDMAKTQAERRKIQLEILASERETARKALAESLARNQNLTPEQRAAQLGAFDQATDAKEGQVRQNTQAPLESYFRSLPADVDQMNERLENLAANGIDSVINGLADAATGARSLGDVFKGVITQMLADITRLNLQRLLGGLVGGQGAGLASDLRAGAAANAFLFADGGSVRGPGTGRSDSVPAMLSNGEFVVNAASARKHRPWLEMINAGRVPHMKDGGMFAAGASLPGKFPSMVMPTDILGGLARRGGETSRTYSPTLHINVQPTPGMTMADARRTGDQIGAAAMQRLAVARRKGF